MAATCGSSSTESLNLGPQDSTDRLKLLYPAVNEEEYPLPRSWSQKDRYNYIGLSQNNLRVHYKGIGKTHKDAASVRAIHPIPASCGIYYFEVKIISKGRDGYMGIGLAAQGVNMNRLPGWDKNSYGYHGDDGHSFCSSGTGQPYGPTFTTGDVIGCCVNLIDNSCFYTKNGVHLGIAFTDLPQNLYPTVGLQSPGEVVEANFGQAPFAYDIEDYMREWHMKTRLTIERFPVNDKRGEWQTALQRIVSTYLVHHGYCATAEAFAKSTGQSFDEELASMKNRQRIQKLVLYGRMGEAIENTTQLYPGLLERNLNLLFMLKCRQFIEMVNGTDSEVRGNAIRSPKSRHGSGSNRSSPSLSPVHHTNSHSQRNTPVGSRGSSPNRPIGVKGHSSVSGSASAGQNNSQTHPTITSQQPTQAQTMNSTNSDLKTISEEEMNAANIAINGNSNSRLIDDSDDVEMIDGLVNDYHDLNNKVVTNGTVESNGNTNGLYLNGNSESTDHEHCRTEDMDIDGPSGKRQLCGGSQVAVEKMLQFGKELQAMSQQLKRQYGKNEGNKKALQDAFSLLAYSDPWNSPMGYQLDPVQREAVCAALNSAILESNGLPKQPPLELVIAQSTECMKLMSKSGIGSSAFASLKDYLH
ncbi:ran-binding protein 9-like [Ylistrum balloti]|uniref:ran-binding protein 9-like n=1 Tax=Ylistrum balloti TaxID=509963 RepID=UPI002905B48F|nr:ran-binding protein 9-like [Ylistrum balloti]